jgi:hypothetical protein
MEDDSLMPEGIRQEGIEIQEANSRLRRSQSLVAPMPPPRPLRTGGALFLRNRVSIHLPVKFTNEQDERMTIAGTIEERRFLICNGLRFTENM